MSTRWPSERGSRASSASSARAASNSRRRTAWPTAAHGIPNTIETQFGARERDKGLTALTVVSLIDDGVLDLVDHGALGRSAATCR